jgi:hypothetical protein
LGEIAFFTNTTRKASAKSRAFTEVLTLTIGDFIDAA